MVSELTQLRDSGPDTFWKIWDVMPSCQKQSQGEVAYPMPDGISDVTVGSMRCSFNIQQARLWWQLYKAGEAASCWSANISSEPLYSSLPVTKCLYLQSACHFPLAGELVYYLARIYLGKTFQFKSTGTTVALARPFPCGSKRQERSVISKGRVSRGQKGPFSASWVSVWKEGVWDWISLCVFVSHYEVSILGFLPGLSSREDNSWEKEGRIHKCPLDIRYRKSPEHKDDMDWVIHSPQWLRWMEEVPPWAIMVQETRMRLEI